ncbi:hypothetical protein [Nocardia cerradoensis]|uniref:Uncharacterized protein n=1 Tax=Nocardia cerradoensis TaxID=85688 RepID=A0A231GVP5_9NOCA|nr:hypothetical protein [Nocardia cerradoensis]NKY48374.1 hypothetical protein [Nocardia cerradoensis]OXR40658.1 hypothetical protein B7C42_07215 [Nocardia cerradoensis]
MQREHEEAMRAEFAEKVALERTMFNAGVTDAEFDRMSRRSNDIDNRWASGPHAEHWAFLGDAHHDWQHNPETMERFRADIAHNLATDGHVGLSDVQVRSLEQARTLTQQQSQQAERPVRER